MADQRQEADAYDKAAKDRNLMADNKMARRQEKIRWPTKYRKLMLETRRAKTEAWWWTTRWLDVKMADQIQEADTRNKKAKDRNLMMDNKMARRHDVQPLGEDKMADQRQIADARNKTAEEQKQTWWANQLILNFKMADLSTSSQSQQSPSRWARSPRLLRYSQQHNGSSMLLAAILFGDLSLKGVIFEILSVVL
jgi:hypothetical protein